MVTNYEWKLNLIINETYRKNQPTLISDHLHFLLSFENVCIFGDWYHLIYGTANQAYQWIENILIYECSSTKTTLLVALVTLASILLVSLKSELMILMWHYASNTLFIFYKHSVFFWISLSMLMIFLIWASLHYAYNVENNGICYHGYDLNTTSKGPTRIHHSPNSERTITWRSLK